MVNDFNSENGTADITNDYLNNSEDQKILPKLTFEELLELELKKEGDPEEIKDKVKPKKNFLKKGKLIKEIYKNEQEPTSKSPRNQKINNLSPRENEQDNEQLQDSPKKIDKKPFLKKGKRIREIYKTDQEMIYDNQKNNSNSPRKRASKSPEKEKSKKKQAKNDDWKKTCQFCGSKNIKSLDEHFINDCPSLFNCKYCEQLVEIQEMKNH